MGQDDIVSAQQLREIMRGKADAPLRQIEAEFMAHRPAQPGIDPRRRRPHALDQPAEDDAVGFASTALRVDRRYADARSPIPAAAPCGRQRRSGTLRDNRRAAPSGRSASARPADRRRRMPAPIPGCPRRRRQRRCDRSDSAISTSRWRCASSAKSCGFDDVDAFQRRQRLLQRRDQRLRLIEFVVASTSRAARRREARRSRYSGVC